MSQKISLIFIGFLIIAGDLFAKEIITITITDSRNTIEVGKARYNTFCIHCHGADGAGTGEAAGLNGVPPVDLSNLAYMSQLQDYEIYERIAYGEERFPYLQMPGWRGSLDRESIYAVIAYVRTLAVDKGPLKGPTPKQKMELFKNNPLYRGRIYYLRYCSLCHGKSGNGNGPMASTLSIKPIAFNSPEVMATLTQAKINDYVMNKVTDKEPDKLRDMPIFSPTIEGQIDEIYLYIQSLAN